MAVASPSRLPLQLTSANPTPTHTQQRPVFSPDGTKIALVICNTMAIDVTGEVFVIDLKTQEVTPLRTSTGATLVPDPNTKLNWIP